MVNRARQTEDKDNEEGNLREVRRRKRTTRDESVEVYDGKSNIATQVKRAIEIEVKIK